jgi:outer membrane receptor protein involved in Fe transport
MHGIIEDDKGRPLAGVVVSALGSTTVFAVSDRDGRFAFRQLPAGPYLVRAHLQGYIPARGRVVQVSSGARTTQVLSLTRLSSESETPTVLAAGVGGGIEQPVTAPEDKEHAHGEAAWRLRHQKRSVLKEAEAAVADLDDDDSPFEDSLAGLGRAVGEPARLASTLLSDLTVDGDFNLLTTTTFNRPQDLFAMSAAEPRGVAYLSLVVPGDGGDWLMRGTITQGDVSSWIVAGSYRRAADATHAYEAGLAYSTQQYLGGNSEALLAMREGSRNVGAIYGFDNWAVAPRLRLGYGARYARYDYLPDESLISPRASITVQPLAHDNLTLRATISHRETAPGSEEFTPPAGGLWLPPERTFSQVSRASFQPERLDHLDFSAEREFGEGVVVGLRAFRQRVDDQVVTLFGLAVPDSNVGHYRVGSAGDFEAVGFSVSASRAVGDGVRASFDYTQFDSRWSGRSPDAIALGQLARSVLRKDERIHDMTASVESIIAPSSTRLFILYKLNTGFAAANDTTPSALHNVRFNVQVNQSLPFLKFMNADWEMLVAVTNVFHDEMLDSSVYDELFVIEPPKRVLGGVTVRF